MTLISIEEPLRIFYHEFSIIYYDYLLFIINLFYYLEFSTGRGQPNQTHIHLAAAKVEYRMHVMGNICVMEI